MPENVTVLASDAFPSDSAREAMMAAVRDKLAGGGSDAGCHVTEFIRDKRLLPATSWSNMLMMLGTWKPMASRPQVAGVAIKFSFRSCNLARDNSQESEQLIYANVISGLFTGSHTPHVLLPYAIVQCGDFTDLLAHIDAKTARKLLPRFRAMILRQKEHMLLSKYGIKYHRSTLSFVDPKEYDTRKNPLRFTEPIARSITQHNDRLATLADKLARDEKECATKLDLFIFERSQGTTLSDTFSEYLSWPSGTWKTVPWERIGAPLFQIMFTLLCFQRVGLMHNDLHTGNIFLDTHPRPVSRTYTFVGPGKKERTVTVTSPHTARIYDFDRGAKTKTSHHPKVIRNTNLDGGMCEAFGACNTFNYFFDAHAVLFVVYGLYKNNALDARGKSFVAALPKRITKELETFYAKRATGKNFYTDVYAQIWCYSDDPCTVQSGKPGDLPAVLDALADAVADDEVLPEAQVYTDPAATKSK